MDISGTDRILRKALGETVAIDKLRRAAGGSINRCALATLADGRELFIKTHAGETIPGMYGAEYRALELLSAPNSLTVPRPVYYDDDYLVIEAFREGAPASDWQERMGRGLAMLHDAARREKFGFECDNYLGTTLQINTWRDDWISFWREQRLGYQFDLFRPRARSDDPLLVLGDKLLNKLDDLLDCEAEQAVLLHGDLWSGNAAANEKGEPVIFDPASYYGHREAEIGMMRLFGGFGPRCEAAYEEVWPFQPGSDRRIDVYRLYHQLNHLNLFGGGYYSGCLATVKSLL